MAKRAKVEKDGDENGFGVSAIRGNGFDPDATQKFVTDVEDLQAKIDEIMEGAKSACAPHREEIGKVKKEAADAGLPRRELNAVIRKRRLLRKVEETREKLSDEQKDSFDQIEQALGMLKDLPLGQAALNSSGGARVGSVGATAV